MFMGTSSVPRKEAPSPFRSLSRVASSQAPSFGNSIPASVIAVDLELHGSPVCPLARIKPVFIWSFKYLVDVTQLVPLSIGTGIAEAQPSCQNSQRSPAHSGGLHAKDSSLLFGLRRLLKQVTPRLCS